MSHHPELDDPVPWRDAIIWLILSPLILVSYACYTFSDRSKLK